ncbi:MAG: hypothetical protein HOJ35_12730 [Bdellovibrionales bacterium]|jgi:flagellar biosynthesis/type III secretory pathway chaperone|nr:hypothetical protein [Bdellovibrionales bacterium]
MDASKLEVIYFKTVDLWNRLCEYHNKLYSITCNEYSTLLKSDLDTLDNILESKKDVINKIHGLDSIRRSIIDEINQLQEKTTVSNVSELINFLQTYEDKKDINNIKKFNSLLIDVIKKIKKQNKHNQLFINKAVLSLEELKQETVGEKQNYATYTSSGAPELRHKIR